jgi:GMP reductase
MATMAKQFDFGDMNLVPKKCIVNSRSEIDTHAKLGKHAFQMPVVPANMECVINDELAIQLAKHGYFYIHHRFNTDIVEFSKKMLEAKLPISISVGVNKDAYDALDLLLAQSICPDFITIDIAHGHSLKMENMIKYIKEKFSSFLIAGNVSTAEATVDLEAWGANAVKVGIGPGSACTTYVATGFGSRGAQASIIQECSKARKNPSTCIIADGGIKDPGDIAKALVMGADMVMIGGMFSGLKDSPGNPVLVDGRMYKEFWGSASTASGKTERIEGVKKLIPLQSIGILDQMNYLKQCLQSAISYGGGKCTMCLQQVKYFVLSN